MNPHSRTPDDQDPSLWDSFEESSDKRQNESRSRDPTSLQRIINPCDEGIQRHRHPIVRQESPQGNLNGLHNKASNSHDKSRLDDNQLEFAYQQMMIWKDIIEQHVQSNKHTQHSDKSKDHQQRKSQNHGNVPATHDDPSLLSELHSASSTGPSAHSLVKSLSSNSQTPQFPATSANTNAIPPIQDQGQVSDPRLVRFQNEMLFPGLNSDTEAVSVKSRSSQSPHGSHLGQIPYPHNTPYLHHAPPHLSQQHHWLTDNISIPRLEDIASRISETSNMDRQRTIQPLDSMLNDKPRLTQTLVIPSNPNSLVNETNRRTRPSLMLHRTSSEPSNLTQSQLPTQRQQLVHGDNANQHQQQHRQVVEIKASSTKSATTMKDHARIQTTVPTMNISKTFINTSDGKNEWFVQAKRQRNTEASARFRAKKKLIGYELQKNIESLQDKISKLEKEIEELASENKWLRDLIVEKKQKDKDPEP